MANVSLTDQIGRVLGSRYRLIAPVGSGSSAQVFVADDTNLKRRVAVKVLHPALAEDEVFLKRFRTEAQAAASLNHPHIMAVYDWGHDDVPYLVSEYLGGGSLRSMLDQGPLSQSQALLIGLEALRGLDHAHKQGLVHRDIKPGNLLFDDEGRLRIADFGLARALAEAGWTEPTDTMLGTVRYASPEQAQGQTLDGKSDVYALALVLYEAMVGELPFVADTAIGTLMARIDNELPPADEMGVLESPVRRAAAPAAEDRPDASAFGVALMAVAEELPRPEPLPLAGTIAYDAVPGPDPDPTMLGGGPMDVLGSGKIATGVSADEVLVPALADPDDYEAVRRWPWFIFFALVLAAVVAAAWVFVQNSTAAAPEVPNFIGRTPEDILDEVADANWVLVENRDRSDDVEAGQILLTDPEAGVALESGETLRIWISLGPSLVELPRRIAGTSLSEVERQLTELGLELGPATTEVDEDVDVDLVIRLKWATPTAERGSVIPVVVSGGPAPRRIPDGLVGQSCEAASEILFELLLDVDCPRENSDDVPKGEIMRVEPEEGTDDVAKGTTVILTVSDGPAARAIPNVIGELVVDANRRLEDAGFCIADVEGPQLGQVTGQDPIAGELATPDGNTCVTLTTREA